MGLFAVDHVIDVTVTGGFPRVKEVSSFELDYRLINDFSDSHVIVNPRFKPLGNKNINAGLGVGHRQTYDWGMLGAHCATDYSYIQKTHNLQIVPSLEFFTKRWDFHMNGYIPVRNMSCTKPVGKLICTHRYFESEVVYKWSYAHLSFSHNFDFAIRQNGYIGKISRAIGPVSLALSGGRDGHHGDHVKLSAIYNLPFGSSKDEHRRVNRHCGAVYDCKIRKESNKPIAKNTLEFIYIEKPTESPIEQPIEPIQTQPSPPVEIQPPVPPKETHWYDFFFNGRNKS